jgi:hypothetical protein
MRSYRANTIPHFMEVSYNAESMSRASKTLRVVGVHIYFIHATAFSLIIAMKSLSSPITLLESS